MSRLKQGLRELRRQAHREITQKPSHPMIVYARSEAECGETYGELGIPASHFCVCMISPFGDVQERQRQEDSALWDCVDWPLTDDEYRLMRERSASLERSDAEELEKVRLERPRPKHR